jgi:hypothetical protein
MVMPVIMPTWLHQGPYMATLTTTPITTSKATSMTMPTTMLKKKKNHAYIRLHLQIVFMVAYTHQKIILL